MRPELEVFIALVAVGFVLLGIEVFVPGGIIGTFGVIFLVGAMIAGFFAFEAQGGLLAAGLMIVLGGLALVFWLKFFPRTPMGRRLTLATDGRSFKSGPVVPATMKDQLGMAQTDLRPGGMAVISGRRVDVVAEAGFVPSGTRLRVVAVEGSRVVVRPVKDAT